MAPIGHVDDCGWESQCGDGNLVLLLLRRGDKTRWDGNLMDAETDPCCDEQSRAPRGRRDCRETKVACAQGSQRQWAAGIYGGQKRQNARLFLAGAPEKVRKTWCLLQR